MFRAETVDQVALGVAGLGGGVGGHEGALGGDGGAGEQLDLGGRLHHAGALEQRLARLELGLGHCAEQLAVEVGGQVAGLDADAAGAQPTLTQHVGEHVDGRLAVLDVAADVAYPGLLADVALLVGGDDEGGVAVPGPHHQRQPVAYGALGPEQDAGGVGHVFRGHGDDGVEVAGGDFAVEFRRGCRGFLSWFFSPPSFSFPLTSILSHQGRGGQRRHPHPNFPPHLNPLPPGERRQSWC